MVIPNFFIFSQTSPRRREELFHSPMSSCFLCRRTLTPECGRHVPEHWLERDPVGRRSALRHADRQPVLQRAHRRRVECRPMPPIDRTNPSARADAELEQRDQQQRDVSRVPDASAGNSLVRDASNSNNASTTTAHSVCQPVEPSPCFRLVKLSHRRSTIVCQWSVVDGRRRPGRAR